jgi:hypothetical protein
MVILASTVPISIREYDADLRYSHIRNQNYKLTKNDYGISVPFNTPEDDSGAHDLRVEIPYLK